MPYSEPVIIAGRPNSTAHRIYMAEGARRADLTSFLARLSEFAEIMWDEGPLIDEDGDLYYECFPVGRVTPDDASSLCGGIQQRPINTSEPSTLRVIEDEGLLFY